MKRRKMKKKGVGVGVDVYSFNEDDAQIELDSKSNMKKYLNSFTKYKKKASGPIPKYKFLDCFSRGSSYAKVGTSEASIIEVDSSNSFSGHKGGGKSNNGDKQEMRDSRSLVSRGSSNYAQAGTSEASIIEVDSGNSGRGGRRKSKTVLLKSLYARATFSEDSVTKGGISGFDEMLGSDTSSHVLSSSDNDESGNIFYEGPGISSCQVKDSSLGVPSAGKIHTTSPDLLSDNDSPDMMSVDVIRVKRSSPRFHSSVIGETEGYSEDSASDHNSSEWGKESINMEAVVSPDLLKYMDKHGKINCSESSLTFSRCCIKLKCTNSYGKREPFSSEWAISQVSSIEYQWFSPVQTALVKISIRPIAEKEVEGANNDPGLLELQLVVWDPCWFKTLERINSMDARYRALWKLVLDNDDSWEVGFSGENSSSGSSCLKHNSPNIDEHFDGVIYPQSGPDVVIITKRDIELLQPPSFLNDTIIDFYIKYLKNTMPPEAGDRFHFFNCFFFRKLADLDKDLPSACQGREAFQRVRKWTSKVNLFEKDYVLIPINFHHHWSLIIICHPGEVAKSKGEDVDNPVKVPCILHMNSIKGSHRGLMKVIQSYLLEEWNERTAGASEDYSSKFQNLRFVNLEVPQQENSYDCGLFLLHYVECFLQEAPVNFSPFNIEKDSNFLSVNWFIPAEASRKRSVICNLIKELAEDRRRGHTATTNNVKHDLPLCNTENDFGEESEMPSVSEASTSGRICHSDSSFSIAGLRIENELRESSAGSFTEAEHQTDSFQQLNYFTGISPSEDVRCIVVSSASALAHGRLEDCIVEDSQEDVRCIVVSSASALAHGRLEDCIVEDSQEMTEKLRLVSPEDVRCLVVRSGSASAHERLEDCIVEDSQEVTEKLRLVSPEDVRCLVVSSGSASTHERLEDCIVEDSQEVTEKLRSVSPEDLGAL